MDKIICLGKNYADHIAEMQEASPELPVLFIKPPSVHKEIKNHSSLALPWERGLIHHELEIVFKLYKKNIIGLGLGLDLTLRDVQKELKTKGHPWEISKVFKHSALTTPIYGLKDFSDWERTTFLLKVNGEIRQQATMADALMKPNEIIHHIDRHFPLCDGDLVFTGTPSGVNKLSPGDELQLEFGPINYNLRLVEYG
jgi:2-keto-4-pentenoate hydratase/2-oxohepta-3-ene-1,7-dioic acid hydratase in catechol pathway